jgi:hypothetical protein
MTGVIQYSLLICLLAHRFSQQSQPFDSVVFRFLECTNNPMVQIIPMMALHGYRDDCRKVAHPVDSMLRLLVRERIGMIDLVYRPDRCMFWPPPPQLDATFVFPFCLICARSSSWLEWRCIRLLTCDHTGKLFISWISSLDWVHSGRTMQVESHI